MLALSKPATHVPCMDKQPTENTTTTVSEEPKKPKPAPVLPKEIGGPEGPEPTRYGDWQYKGRVTDF